VTSIAAADRQLERLMHAAGGVEAFLENYAVIVTSDHSQAAVEERIRLDRAFADFDVATQSAARSAGAEVALSPAQRAAMIYALDPDQREPVVNRSLEVVTELDGVDLALWLPDPSSDEAAIRSGRGELRFTRGGELTDLRGGTWSVEGDLATIRAEVQDGRLLCTEYSDVGRRAPVGRTRVRVRRLGRRRPRRRRQPWLDASLGFAGRADVVRHRAGLPRRARTVVAARRRPDDPRPFPRRIRSRLTGR
jgi:hypothetical protein